jgi:hypothetical protein
MRGSRMTTAVSRDRRAALMRTGAFGPPRPKDEAAQAQLRTSLLSNESVETLEPDFEPYA